MALSPLTPEEERVIELEATEPSPSKTYRLDTDSIGGLIDGKEALRQFIVKTVRTSRFRFLIYDDQYGSELEDLIGEDISQELLQTEIPRVIRESLIYDDRISDVVDFSVTRDSNNLYVAFRVVTTDGTELTEEVTF